MTTTQVEDVLDTKIVYLSGLTETEVMERFQMLDGLVQQHLAARLRKQTGTAEIQETANILAKYIGFSTFLKALQKEQSAMHHIVLHDERHS